MILVAFCGSPLPEHRVHVGVGLVVLVGLVVMLAFAFVVGGARSANQASGLIAFARDDGVYIMRADGTGARLLRRTGGWTFWGGLAWSPNGRKIAFVTYGPETGLSVMNADGRNLVSLVAPRPGLSPFGQPTWSPDSRKIAFAAQESPTVGGRSDIWIVNADGSHLRRLTTSRLVPGAATDPDWSPAGDRIAFSSGWPSDVYVIDTNRGNLRNLTPGRDGTSSTEPDWSPDGRRIAITHAVPFGQEAPRSLEARNDEIFVMDANGRSRARLTNNHVPDHDPTWSADGTTLAFVGAYAGGRSSEIYVMNADGTGVKRLTHNQVADMCPAWQPTLPAR